MRASASVAAGRRRRAGVLALLLPVAASLLLVAARDLRPGEVREVSCWILPNLRALSPPGPSGCGLDGADALRRVSDQGRVVSLEGLAHWQSVVSRSGPTLVAWVEREGRTRPIEIPVHRVSRSARALRLLAASTVAGLLLALAVSLRLRSAASAASPLALLYAVFSLLAVCLVCGRASLPASIALLTCTILVPGLLLHLAFSFPTESRLRRELPAVVALPYAASAFLLVMGGVALWQTPALWPAFLTVLLAACAGAWTLLILACAFRMRESVSALERVRSRVVLVASLLLPVLPVGASAVGGAAPASGLPALSVWSCVCTLPLPVALAISRYNLFDLGLDARQGVARMLYLTASASGIAGCAWIASRLPAAGAALPGAWLAGAFLCALAVEPLRARLPRALESWLLPRLPALRSARRALERRLPGLEDEQEVWACAEQALVAGVAARWGAFFSTLEGAPRPVHAFGRAAAASSALAARADAALGAERWLHVASAPSLRALDAAGVAFVAALEGRGERVGLLLLGPPTSGAIYQGVEVAFAATVACRTGCALGRVRARAARRMRERELAAGRLALALAEDTGKDLHWLRLLSRRLAAHPHASRRVRRDAAMVAELGRALAGTLEGLLHEAAAHPVGGPGEIRLDHLVAAVVRRASRAHGQGRIVDVVEPSARSLRCPDSLARSLEEALDRALRTRPAGEPVHLCAQLEDGRLRLRVGPRGQATLDLPLCIAAGRVQR